MIRESPSILIPSYRCPPPRAPQRCDIFHHRLLPFTYPFPVLLRSRSHLTSPSTRLLFPSLRLALRLLPPLLRSIQHRRFWLSSMSSKTLFNSLPYSTSLYPLVHAISVLPLSFARWIGFVQEAKYGRSKSPRSSYVCRYVNIRTQWISQRRVGFDHTTLSSYLEV